jgi:hypothetical protein
MEKIRVILAGVAVGLVWLGLALSLGGCGTMPPSPNPVVRTLYRSVPMVSARQATALDVYNPNDFPVLTDVHCDYTEYRWTSIPAKGNHIFAIKLGDESCRVEFWR